MSPALANRRTLGGLAFAVLTGLLGFLAAPGLPAQMVTHWNAAGVPDDTMAREIVLVGGPALVLGVVVLFEAIPRIDPLADNIANFQGAYDAIALVTAGFLAYVYGIVLAWNLGYEVAIGQALAPAFAVLYVALGTLLERSKRNWFVGIRTPWTLSSDEVWRRTHALGGTLFKLSGPVALAAIAFPEQFVYLVVVPAAAIALVTTIHSFVVYRRIDDGDPAEGPTADG